MPCLGTGSNSSSGTLTRQTDRPVRAKRTLDRKKRCHALKKEHGTEPSYEDEPRTKPRTEQNPVLDFSPQLLGHNSGIDVLLWLCFCFRGGSLALSCNLTDMFYTGTSIRFRDFPGRLPEVSDVAVIDNVSSRLDWRFAGTGQRASLLHYLAYRTAWAQVGGAMVQCRRGHLRLIARSPSRLGLGPAAPHWILLNPSGP